VLLTPVPEHEVKLSSDGRIFSAKPLSGSLSWLIEPDLPDVFVRWHLAHQVRHFR